jgi:hypothetical protein
MSKNRGVVYTKPGEVQVQDIADPKFENPRGRKIEHGVILKVVSTNICGPISTWSAAELLLAFVRQLVAQSHALGLRQGRTASGHANT